MTRRVGVERLGARGPAPGEGGRPPYRAALDKLVDAWEALPTGDYRMNRAGAERLQRWLSDDMAPAIRDARRVLGRET